MTPASDSSSLPPHPAPTPESALPKVELNAALSQTMHHSLRPVALGLGLLAAVFAIVQPWVLADLTGFLRGLAAVTAVTLGGIGLALGRLKLPVRYAYPLGAAITALMWFNVMAQLALTGDSKPTLGLALIVVGLGIFFLSTPWFIAGLTVVIGSWLAVTRWTGATADWTHYAFYLLSAGVLAGLVHVVRRRNLIGQEHLRRQLESRQRELEQSQERYRALSAATTEGVLIHDQGIVLDVNQALADMLGGTRPELIGQSAFSFMTPESQALARAHFHSGYDQPYTVTVVRRDGSTFPAELVGKPGTWLGRAVRVVVVRDLTERQRAEAALREAEQKYRALIEYTPAVVYTNAVDEHSSAIYISPQIERLTGYTVAEWLADPELWPRLLYPDDYPYVMAENMRTNLTGEPFRVEYRLVTRDGRVVWVRDEAVLVRTGDDQPAFWHGYLLDITELKKAEAAHAESEQRYRDLFVSAQRQAQNLSLLDKVRTALARQLDLPDVIRTVVDSIAETLGYTLVSIYLVVGDELVLQHQVGYAHVIERIPHGQGVLWRTMQSGQPQLIKDVRADPAFLGAISGIVSEICVPLVEQGQTIGGLNVESVHGVPLDEADLQVLVAVGRQASIAIERARLYAQVRENELTIRALYDITASQTRPFAEQVLALLALGCRRFRLETGLLSRIDGQQYQLVEVLSPDNRLAAGQTLDLQTTYCRETLARSEPLSIEQASASDDFKNHPCHLIFELEAYLGAPVRVGGIVYGTLAFFDRAPRHPAFTPTERELLRLMAQWLGSELERQQHTRQLQAYADEIAQKNEALAEARDQALEVSRFKSEFLASVSREIRTPLNAIVGMSDLLAETPLTSEQRDYTLLMRDSAAALIAIVNDIMDFSRVESGRLGLEQEDFNLLDVVEQAAETLAPQARQKGLSLMTFVAPDIPPRLRGDAGRVRQVLLNLIGNAVKFTDAGEVVVRAALEADTPTHVTLRLTVSDTGPGLPESARPHLFKPFMRADSGVTQPLGGAGLGLPIARRLVELMGGAIGLESGGPESHGATFWFTARFERAPETPPPEPPALTVGRVLVVDDSRTSLEFVQHYLIDGGVSAGGARTSAEALAQLRRAAAAHDPYRVALIDYHLPEMDGFAVARAIQADVRLAETKLVLFTAHAEPGLAERAQQAGFAAYITKPIKREELFETLRAISSPAAQPAARPTRRGAVLLVEDNQVNRRVVQLQLKKLGYTVQTVNDGRAAVEAVARAEPPFGAILMDVQMPEMDGLTATRLIRQAETGTLSHIPIIALTAHARPSDRADCLAAGMDDFLSKPINVAQLRETLARWLAEGEPSAPESDRPAAGPLNTRA